MKKNLLLIPALGSSLLLAGCGAGGVLGAWAGGAYATKPGDPPSADTEDQIAPHESWCYRTMGEQVECFSEPQDTSPGRLVNVDPASRYPLNKRAYDAALEKSKMAAKAADEPKNIASDQGVVMPPAVQPAEVTPAPVHMAPKADPSSKPAVKHKHKKHKKKTEKSPPSAPVLDSQHSGRTPPAPGANSLP